uniref:Transmembrane protein n=1 Tax=Fagus sylvatica TaxID=28930 RepID=A0A2N9IK98_FAGSY
MASSESILEGVGFLLQTWVWWLGLGCRCGFGGLVLCCWHGFGGWGWVAGVGLVVWLYVAGVGLVVWLYVAGVGLVVGFCCQSRALFLSFAQARASMAVVHLSCHGRGSTS